MNAHKCDKRRTDQDFVRQRVHQNTEIRDQLVFAGNLAVEIVREACEAEKNQRNSLVKADLGKNHREERHRQNESRNGELVGKVHANSGSVTRPRHKQDRSWWRILRKIVRLSKSNGLKRSSRVSRMAPQSSRNRCAQ